MYLKKDIPPFQIVPKMEFYGGYNLGIFLDWLSVSRVHYVGLWGWIAANKTG